VHRIRGTQSVPESGSHAEHGNQHCNPFFRAITLAGLTWAVGNVEVDVPPNIDKVTPKASQLTADE